MEPFKSILLAQILASILYSAGGERHFQTDFDSTILKSSLPVEIAKAKDESRSSMSGPALAVTTASVVALQAFLLHQLGRPWISRSGKVEMFEASVFSAENSQQLTDPYTATHVLHGFILYLGTQYLVPSLSLEEQFLLALALESGWEVLENSEAVISLYRKGGQGQGYNGDTVVNSVADTVAMSLGFWLASKLPLPFTIALALLEELLLLLTVRDGLFLNILQLIHPSQAVSRWQLDLKTQWEKGQKERHM